MTTKYSTMNRKTKPMSMFRYPYKNWKFYDNDNPYYQSDISLVCHTYTFNGITIDFKFYKGDEKNFKNYFEEVLRIFHSSDLRDSESTPLDLDDYNFVRYIVDYSGNCDHYTVICHSCELWGNERTKKYVEIFPTYEFKLDRFDRNSLFGFFEKGKFKNVRNFEFDMKDREQKTMTPSFLLLKNSNRKKYIEDVIEMMSDLNSNQLLQLIRKLNEMKNQKLEVSV